MWNNKRSAPSTPFARQLSPRQVASKAHSLASQKLNRDEHRRRPVYHMRERVLLYNTMTSADSLLNKRTPRFNRRVMAAEEDDLVGYDEHHLHHHNNQHHPPHHHSPLCDNPMTEDDGDDDEDVDEPQEITNVMSAARPLDHKDDNAQAHTSSTTTTSSIPPYSATSLDCRINDLFNAYHPPRISCLSPVII